MSDKSPRSRAWNWVQCRSNTLKLVRFSLRLPSELPAGSLRPVVEVGAGDQGLQVLRAEHPVHHGQQRRQLVPRPGRIPASPARERGWRGRSGSAGAPGAPGQAPGPSRAAAPPTDPAPRPHPRPPGHVGEGDAGAQGIWVVAVSTRSITGSSAALWSRAAAASPASRSSGRGFPGIESCSPPGRAPAQARAAAPPTDPAPRPHSPACPVQRKVSASAQGVRVLGSRTRPSTGNSATP